ncbi:MAG: type VI secretion protein [Acidobacteriia bacterium]|nr:type VI secretion protein [Terriglobia bacterium]
MAILLVLVGSSCKRPEPKVSQAEVERTLSAAQKTLDELKGWRVSTETDKMDNTPAVYLSKLAESGGHGAMLTIRCTRGKTELYVGTDDIVDNGKVRIKFDDAKPQQQSWSEASDHQGLFAPDPIGLAKRLVKADSFLFEYSPFQKQPTTVEFKVNGLAEKLTSVAEPCGWARIEEAKARAQAYAKGEPERARKRDAMLREALSRHVGACHEKWLQDMGRWCWYDESAYGFKGGIPFESKEAALDDAVQRTKSGQFFTHEMAQIDSELKEE